MDARALTHFKRQCNPSSGTQLSLNSFSQTSLHPRGRTHSRRSPPPPAHSFPGRHPPTGAAYSPKPHSEGLPLLKGAPCSWAVHNQLDREARGPSFPRPRTCTKSGTLRFSSGPDSSLGTAWTPIASHVANLCTTTRRSEGAHPHTTPRNLQEPTATQVGSQG